MSQMYNYSPCLFCNDIGEGFTFVIKPCEEKEELRALVEYGGGEVVSTLCDTGVVFIPQHVEIVGDDEVYSTKYIRDCCEHNSFLDLVPYRLNIKSIVPEELDVREILWKSKTWSEVFGYVPKASNSSPIPEKQPENAKDDSVFKKPYPKIYNMYNEESDSSGDEIEFIYVFPNVQSEDEGSDTDETITSYASTDEDDNTTLSEPRSYASTYASTDEEDDTPMSEPRASNSSPVLEKQPENAKDDCVFKKPYPKIYNMVKDVQESSAVESAKINEIVMTENVDQESGNGNSDKELRKSECFVQGNLSDYTQEFEEFESYSSKRKLPSHKRMYTEAERRAILDYIITYQLGAYIKGNDVWKKMEVKKVCPGRTWQSLKEHFKKYILDDIDKYNLPEEVVRQFKY